MKKYIIMILCLLSLQCNRSQKEIPVISETRTGGVIESTPDEIDRVPVIMSLDFYNRKLNSDILYRGTKGKPAGNYDDDKDGIINKNDLCPTSPETYNGYLDTDGCPDEIVIVTPPPPPPPAPETGVIIKMPTPINQGSEGSCVAMAVGYAARSAEWYYKTGASTYSNSTNIFSPEFVYNLSTFSTTECGSGTSMQTALDVIVNKGVPTFSSMPYSSTNGCSPLIITENQFAEAANYKISGYSKILFTDRAAIKSMISQNHPVIITILADNSFISAPAGFIWKSITGGMLAHSVTICGYDDTKNAYKIINSWGTGWGDGGFSWIDYNFFETGGRTAGAGYVYVIN